MSDVPASVGRGLPSPDTSFVLNLDTKQRFDNILSDIKKPIAYPIPQLNGGDGNGVHQDKLLDPNFVNGSLGEGIFSPDPKVARYATDRLNSLTSSQTQPISHGVGVPDVFPYDKSMDKYIKGDYGYNPYISLEANESFNYRYDYLNQSILERLAKNIGVGTTRFIGSTASKLIQTVGHVGTLLGELVEEVFDGKNNNLMLGIAENSLSRWAADWEQDMKNSNLLSVFKPNGWDEMGFLEKAKHGAFWTDEFADGAAFMAEMVLSSYMLGGLGKVGVLGKIGSTAINTQSRLGKAGNVIDKAIKFGTGSDTVGDLGRWAFLTTSESLFESSEKFRSSKEDLILKRENGEDGYADLSDEEINKIAGDNAAASFKGNMAVLAISSAFENRFILKPLLGGSARPGSSYVSKLISVTSGKNIDDFAKASRKQYHYKTKVGKILNLKDPNSRVRFYGKSAGRATLFEGYWEENSQLAIDRLVSEENLSPMTLASSIFEQAGDAFMKDDPEAATSIGLGAVIGIGGSTFSSKVAKERRQRNTTVEEAIAKYNVARKEFLSFNDIYEYDKDGNVVMQDGKPKVDTTKALGVLAGLNEFSNGLNAASHLTSPLTKRFMQENLVSKYVFAAKSAGIFSKVLSHFENLNNMDPQTLMNLGFDPNPIADHTTLTAAIKKAGENYDSVFNGKSARLRKGDTEEDEFTRKTQLFSSLNRVDSLDNIKGEAAKELRKTLTSPSSPEAEQHLPNVEAYNTLAAMMKSLAEFEEYTKKVNNSFYDEYIKNERKEIEKEMLGYLENIRPDIEASRFTLIDGYLVSSEMIRVASAKGKGKPKTKKERIEKAIGEYFKPILQLAKYTSAHNQHSYLADTLSDLDSGISNMKSLQKWYDDAGKVNDEETKKEVDSALKEAKEHEKEEKASKGKSEGQKPKVLDDLINSKGKKIEDISTLIINAIKESPEEALKHIKETYVDPEVTAMEEEVENGTFNENSTHFLNLVSIYDIIEGSPVSEQKDVKDFLSETEKKISHYFEISSTKGKEESKEPKEEPKKEEPKKEEPKKEEPKKEEPVKKGIEATLDKKEEAPKKKLKETPKTENNFLDAELNAAKESGEFIFYEQFPHEVVMDATRAKLKDGAIVTRMAEGKQTEQARRQHNVKRKYTSANNPINFFSLTEDGKPVFKLKLIAGNKEQHESWVYDPSEEMNIEHKKFPEFIAVITDAEGRIYYFDTDGNIVNENDGKPVAFVYQIKEYTKENLNRTRRAILAPGAYSGEELSGGHGFSNDDPLEDIRKAVRMGIPVFASIQFVTSGIISRGASNNKPTVNQLDDSDDYQMRTINQMIDDGDITDDDIGKSLIIKVGEAFPLSSQHRGEQQQIIKKGQPYIYVVESGTFFSLRGKQIGDITINGEKVFQGQMLDIILGLEKDGILERGDMSETSFLKLHEFLKKLFYSEKISFVMNKDNTEMIMEDNRSDKKPILNEELNYTDLDLFKASIENPATETSIFYFDFVAENFMSGARKAWISPTEKRFEKLNRRVAIKVDMNHENILDAISANETVDKEVHTEDKSLKAAPAPVVSASPELKKEFKERIVIPREGFIEISNDKSNTDDIDLTCD